MANIAKIAKNILLHQILQFLQGIHPILYNQGSAPQTSFLQHSRQVKSTLRFPQPPSTYLHKEITQIVANIKKSTNWFKLYGRHRLVQIYVHRIWGGRVHSFA